jgi:hypothetical protein
VSTHEYRRGIRHIGLLLIAAFAAITIAAVAVSKADALSWGTAAKAVPNTNSSARTAAQGPNRGAVALGGFTSQGWPIVLELGRGGKLVTVAAAGMDMTCASGDRFSVEDGWQLLDIAKNGKIHASEQIPPGQGQAATLTGGSHSLTGRFDRHRLTFRGTWTLQLNFKAADGTTDQCQSGPVKLIATL